MIAPSYNWNEHAELYREWGRHPEIGFHFGVPASVYFSWAGMSSSALKPLARSPGHYQRSLLFPWEGSKATQLGDAVDIAWFDNPELLTKRYVTPPFPLPRKKNGQPYSNWLASTDGKKWKQLVYAAGQSVFSLDEAFKVFGMVLALNSDPDAMELRRTAAVQVSLVFDHPATGVRCKARLDFLNGLDGEPPYDPADLKTTSAMLDPSKEEHDPFAKRAGELRYDRQAGFYCAGLTELTGVEHTSFKIIAVEHEPPHPVAVYEMDETQILTAQYEIEELLWLYTECHALGEWPSSPPKQSGVRYHRLIVPGWTR